MTALAQNVVSDRPKGETEDPAAEPSTVSLLKTIADHLSRLLDIAEANAVQESARKRYTTEEVAKIFSKQPRTPQKWCRDRQVHCIRLSRDGTYRLTREEVERVRSHGLLSPGAGVVTVE